MCCAMEPAEFKGTMVAVIVKNHPVHGLIHVVLYQNTAINFAKGPNAMILHFPAAEIMTRANVIDMGECTDVLKKMVRVLNPPRPRSLTRATYGSMVIGASAPRVEVFEHDIYTIAIGEARGIPEALATIREDRRPAPNEPLFSFYDSEFPDYSTMEACFDNRQVYQAKPLAVWYKPMDEDRLVLPSLDCHTGGVPDVNADVWVDHWVIVGYDDMDGGKQFDPSYGCEGLSGFLPTRINGLRLSRYAPNGDFVIDLEDATQGLTNFGRAKPPRYNEVVPLPV